MAGDEATAAVFLIASLFPTPYSLVPPMAYPEFEETVR